MAHTYSGTAISYISAWGKSVLGSESGTGTMVVATRNFTQGRNGSFDGGETSTLTPQLNGEGHIVFDTTSTGLTGTRSGSQTTTDVRSVYEIYNGTVQTSGNLYSLTDSGESPPGGGSSINYLLPSTDFADDPPPEQNASLSTGGLGYFASAFGFKGGIVGATFATALPGDPTLPGSTNFGDTNFDGESWMQDPGQDDGVSNEGYDPINDVMSITVDVPLDIQLRYGKKDPETIIGKDKFVEEWWVGSFRHSVWQVGKTYYYVVTHEPRAGNGWLPWRVDLKTVAAGRFTYDGTAEGRDLMLAELRKNEFLNNIGSSASAAMETAENARGTAIVIYNIASTILPIPNEATIILAAAAKGYQLVKAGRTSYHIYKNGQRLTGEAQEQAAKDLLNLVDFSQSASRIPGAQWKNFDQLSEYLARQKYFSNEGVGLIKNGDSILDGLGVGKNAAYAIRNGRPYIVLRSGATNREVLHELGHMLTHKHLGNDAYNALSKSAREHLASTFVRSRDSFSKMTPDEIWQELKAIDPDFVPTDAIRQLLRQWGALIE